MNHSSINPVHTPVNGGKLVNVLGTPIFIRVHGRDTGGVVSAVVTHDAPNGGPPPHIHRREDETFQVLEGEYEFAVDGKTFIAQEGATIFAPRNVPHTYRCVSPKSGRLLCVINPAGFEEFFEAVGALSPQEQQDIPRIVEIGGRYGMEILPPLIGA